MSVAGSPLLGFVFRNSIYSGVIAMVGGLVLVPIVSALTKKTVPADVDRMFLCYEDKKTVDITDSEGVAALPVKGGKWFTEMHVGKSMLNYDSLLVLTHFKGHMMGGFGGALKNLSIGVASTAGKARIHSAGKTDDAGKVWGDLPSRSTRRAWTWSTRPTRRQTPRSASGWRRASARTFSTTPKRSATAAKPTNCARSTRGRTRPPSGASTDFRTRGRT